MSDSTIFDKLQKISKTSGAGYLKPSLSQTAIGTLCGRVKEQFNDEIPGSYLKLLAMSDGVQIDAAWIYDSGTFWDINNELRKQNPSYKSYFILGCKGNMDRYLFNKLNQQFEVTNFFDPKHVFETFESFEALLAHLLESQGIEDSR